MLQLVIVKETPNFSFQYEYNFKIKFSGKEGAHFNGIPIDSILWKENSLISV